MDFKDFKQSFVDEAMQLINSLDEILLNLEKDFENSDYIEHIFRVMHTLKGSSSMFGFDLVADVTHNLESLYVLVRDKKLRVNENIIQLTFETIDILRHILNSKEENPKFEQNCAEITKKILGIVNKSGNSITTKKVITKTNLNEIKKRSWNIIFFPSENIFTRNIKLLNTFHDLFQLGEYQISSDLSTDEKQFWNIILVTEKTIEDIEDALFFIIDNCKISLIADFDILNEDELIQRENFIKEISENEENNFEIFEPDIQNNEAVEKNSDELKPELVNQFKQTANRIIVDAQKLDTLIYLVSELFTSKSDLLLSLESKDFERIKTAAEKIDKLSKLFRDNALSIRLVSLHDLISRFRRLVRDLAKQLNKNVEFEVIGEDTELDKSVIEAISEPIMHLIRNCIDHGIENPEKRIEMGKNANGIIKLFAFKKGSFVFIQISDDGNGIDKQKVMQKAISKNMISENAQLSDKEIYDLLFLPGFSTAESLTQVSGRGVGMDVVRKKISEIRGDITVDSEKGLGTSFTLKLQQTIAIIDTLLIRTDNTKFAVPIEDIENCGLITIDEIQKTNNKHVEFQNELIPYISIRSQLGYKSQNPNKQRILIINKQDKRYAILADDIIGEYQAVIKPLGKTFSEQEFLSGVSILGDGTLALLLDTEKLKKQITLIS